MELPLSSKPRYELPNCSTSRSASLKNSGTGALISKRGDPYLRSNLVYWRMEPGQPCSSNFVGTGPALPHSWRASLSSLSIKWRWPRRPGMPGSPGRRFGGTSPTNAD